MPISVECPACEHEFRIPNSYGGKKGKCPECGEIFVAPSATSPSPRRTSRVPPPRPAAHENGRNVPVPPPPSAAGSANTAVADPPVAMDGDPPIAKSPTVSRPLRQPPLADSDRRPKGNLGQGSKNTPLWIALGVLSAMLVVGAILFVKNMRLEGKEVVGDTQKVDPPKRAKPNVDKAAAEKPVEASPSEVDLKKLQLDRRWEKTRPAVFRLVAKRGDDTTSGLAFAIDERGWLATSYELIKDAESVNVSAVDDPTTERMPAKGILASNAEHNVAIIAIQQELSTSLSLDVATPKIDQELAVCRFREAGGCELVHGYFRELASLERLTPNSRAIARNKGLDRAASLIWLEHDQPLEPIDRGGPLLNSEGNVIGINTTLSPDSKTGFALPAAYLIELVESAGDKVTPFAHTAGELALGNPATEPRNVASGDVPQPPVRPEAGSLESIDAIRELQEVCKEIDWQPATSGEYELFQDLAEYIHVAKTNESDERIEEGLRILIAAPAQEVLVELSKTPWPDEPGMTNLNALAVEGLKDGKGVFCYVEVAITSPSDISIDGAGAIVCNLIGTEQAVVVPVEKESPLLRKRSRWLLIGMHDSTQTIDLRGDDGSESVVPLVRAKNLLGQPTEKKPEKARPSRRGRR